MDPSHQKFVLPRKRRRTFIWSLTLLTGLLLVFGFMYAYEVPGGIADWRYARAIGLSGTLRIPIGKTPEEAVQRFRGGLEKRVIRQESIEGGKLLFLKQYNQKPENTDLQIEYVRKTWLGGWKWAMGGGYGYSLRPGSEEAFTYMSIRKSKGVSGPFPIVFGEVNNEKITNITVTVGGKRAGEYAAKLIEYARGQRLWYVELPTSAETPYTIAAYNGAGESVASQSDNDSQNFAYVLMPSSLK
ncbi:hypothetical protein [Cohnella sp. GCM10027633]|uniref:hypothetical protein n=1 Tax=unclassified Cohnella TaxID=2636738 RepID=UPI00363B112A